MVYRNAKIFCENGEFIENGFILVENGLIKKVGTMLEYEEKYEEEGVKDFSGFVIYPGFIDAHNHIGIWETAFSCENYDVNEFTNPITPHLRAIDAINPKDEAFKHALKAGITTVVTGPGSSNPIAGSFVALKTFGECVDEMIIKNPVGIKFSLGENPKHVYFSKNSTPVTRMGTAALIRKQLAKAKFYEKKIKGSENENFDFESCSLLPLLKRKVKAFFHCHRADDIFTAIRISKEFNLDFVLVHATEGHLIAKYLKNLNVILGPLICDISKKELKNFNEQNPYILNKNKSNIAICTDFPEFSIQYLNLLCSIAIKNGLLEKQAILSITKNAAISCGMFNLVGGISCGKMANFAVFRRDEYLFSPYVSPNCVVVDGNIVFKK